MNIPHLPADASFETESTHRSPRGPSSALRTRLWMTAAAAAAALSPLACDSGARTMPVNISPRGSSNPVEREKLSRQAAEFAFEKLLSSAHPQWLAAAAGMQREPSPAETEAFVSHARERKEEIIHAALENWKVLQANHAQRPGDADADALMDACVADAALAVTGSVR